MIFLFIRTEDINYLLPAKVFKNGNFWPKFTGYVKSLISQFFRQFMRDIKDTNYFLPSKAYKWKFVTKVHLLFI